MRKIQVRIPDIQDVTVGQYQEYLSLIESIEDEERDVSREVIAIFANLDIEIIGKMPAAKVAEAMMGIQTILGNISGEHGLIKTFDLLDQKFGFIPDLENATFDEYVDTDTFLKDPANDLHNLLAVLYRPVTKEKKLKGIHTYQIEEYDEAEKYAMS